LCKDIQVDDHNTLMQPFGEAATDDNPPAAQSEPVESKPIYAQSGDDLLVIPRVVFNYGVIAVSFFVLGLVIGGIAAGRLGDANRAENEALINQAIAAASESLGSAAARQPTGPDPNVRYDASPDNDPFTGPENAPITIVEFGDFKCTFCARFNRETVQSILNDYEGQVRIVFRDYPILGTASLEAAFAAECANDQGAFWPYHDLLYENQQILGRDTYLALAEQLQLDLGAFTTCFDNQTHRDEVLADYADGQRLGVTGTPTFYVNGRPVVGAQPYTVFATAIDDELAAIAASETTS
jgi:protein-disulfide isomerase